jgi:ketosteroid isomerase-like protein
VKALRGDYPIYTSDAMDLDTASELSAILAVTDQEARAISTGDLALYRAILSDDAVFLPPNTSAKSGDELRRWLGDFLDQVAVEYRESADGKTLVSGDLAYHEYTCAWTTTPRAGGPSALMYFKGLHVLERAPAGSWKIARNIWNTSPPPGCP